MLKKNYFSQKIFRFLVILLLGVMIVDAEGARNNRKKKDNPLDNIGHPPHDLNTNIPKIPISDEQLDNYQPKQDAIIHTNASLCQQLTVLSDQKIPVLGPMILCQPGTFVMGSKNSEKGRKEDEVLHKVTLSKPFLLGKYEITQTQYVAIMGKTRAHFRDNTLPVEQVKWDEAVEFCRRLNILYQNQLPQGYEFGLPTEAQWEYACRAGTSTPYAGYSLDSMGWYNLNSGKTERSNSHTGSTKRVGNKVANDWGFHDMHGNVWEWCHDEYRPLKMDWVTDPVNTGTTSHKVIRGGSWEQKDHLCRSARRNFGDKAHSTQRIGFRLAIRPIISLKTGFFLKPAKKLTIQRSAAKLAENRQPKPLSDAQKKQPHQTPLKHELPAGSPKIPVGFTIKNETETLILAGKFDGSGVFAISSRQISYHHLSSAKPANVTVGGIAWPDLDKPFLLPQELDFATITVQVVKGRGFVTETRSDSEILLEIDDFQQEAGDYEIKIDCERKIAKPSKKLTDAEMMIIELPDKVRLEMIKVETGTFTMGRRDGENYDREREHQATLIKDFYLGKFEITQGQWKAVMGTTLADQKVKARQTGVYGMGNQYPMYYISWNEAMSFCEKLNQSRLAPEGWSFSLPTETQWEYAATGGKKSRGYKYSGSNFLDEVGWYNRNSNNSTHIVGTKKANELGFHDMSGNLWE